MSAKERDRLKVLHEVRKRHITQRQAAAELGISVGGCELCSAFAGAWGRGTAASIARPTFEPQNAGRAKTASRRTVSAEKAVQALARLWAKLGGGRTVRAAWDPHQPGDATPLACRGQAMAGAVPWCCSLALVTSVTCCSLTNAPSIYEYAPQPAPQP